MAKRYEGLSVRPQALVLSPEAPYPAVGGGALRTSSLIDYLARRYNVDVITFRENGVEPDFPSDRVRDALTLDLAQHSKTPAARAARNLSRFLGGRPPLLDRYAGFENRVADWAGDRIYPITVIEHFWCAPYGGVLRENSERLVLDLHNLESELQNNTARASAWPVSMMFRRFGAAYEALEREWLPRFDDVLVASKEDGQRLKRLAPGIRAVVYPNVIPRCDLPETPEENAIAFSGNLEYHANDIAIRWFAKSIWPRIRLGRPDLEWRLIGKRPEAVKIRAPGMKLVGPVEDAVQALAAAKVVVVPLLSGSGTRFKILEAWAASRAVVSTSLGADGLGATDGEHLVIADDEAGFAAAVEAMLADAEMRQRIGANGRKLYLERFTTEAGWRALESAGL